MSSSSVLFTPLAFVAFTMTMAGACVGSNGGQQDDGAGDGTEWGGDYPGDGGEDVGDTGSGGDESESGSGSGSESGDGHSSGDSGTSDPECEAGEIVLDGECVEDPCADDPCNIEDGHGETCTPSGAGTYDCTCLGDYTAESDCTECPDGTVPANDHECKDPCEDVDCGDHGECVVDGSGPGTCDCEDGWSGDSCEEPPPVNIDDLEIDCSVHGGVCLPDGLAYQVTFVAENADNCEVDPPQVISGAGDAGSVGNIQQGAPGEWSFAYTTGSTIGDVVRLSVTCFRGSDDANGALEVTLGRDPAMDPAGGEIVISSVEINQGSAVELISNGSVISPGQRPSPVVGSREGIIRAYWSIPAGWQPRAILARLYWMRGDQVDALDSLVDVSGSSDAASLEQTFTWELSAEELVADARYFIALYEGASGGPAGDVVPVSPDQGFADLEGVAEDAELHVVLVPVQYSSSGCNTNSADILDEPSPEGPTYLELISRELYVRNPLQNLQLEVRASTNYSGSTWDGLLGQLQSLRAQDGANPETYYYAMWDSCNSNPQGFGGYSYIATASMDDANQRVSAGRWTTNELEFSLVTIVHEIGHAQGRYHAPCNGPAGPDPNYPHNNAEIGFWGYDVVTGQLKHPTDVKDYMSYCYFPSWASDYAWRLHHERAVILSSWSRTGQPPKPARPSWSSQAVLLASVGPAGDARSWTIGAGTVSTHPGNTGWSVEYIGRRGRTVVVPARLTPASEGDRSLLVAPLPVWRHEILRARVLHQGRETEVPLRTW